MKKVSFSVAKALKEAGYPQYGHCEEYYDSHGKVVDKMCDMHKLVYPRPTYLEVWLWLWREKQISIDAEHLGGNKFANFVLGQRIFTNGQYQTDPEEAIIKAIEYLAQNDLIK